jgi:hypothetical protein
MLIHNSRKLQIVFITSTQCECCCSLCSSYPRHLIVPTSITDTQLKSSADFRLLKRMPVCVWRHRNGAVLMRSAQPTTGPGLCLLMLLLPFLYFSNIRLAIRS